MAAETIGYARVSTRDQNPQLQLDALQAAGCRPIFTDHASGARTDRPELTRALERLRDGDTLVVWKLDRLGRSLRHLIDLADDLQARGVGFRSLTEGLDTTTPGGKLIYHVMGALAEFERDLLRERTRAGLDAAAAQGRRGGRPTVMTPSKLRAAQGMIGAGELTMEEIAATVGVSRRSLYRALTRQRVAQSAPGNARGFRPSNGRVGTPGSNGSAHPSDSGTHPSDRSA
jgi:DNA invertase Pin-like site-specific DNA recombinase